MSTLSKQIGFAILTFVIYALLFNWQVAATLCVGIGFHEYSHLWAAKKAGLSTKGFYLIPFVGGLALVTERYKSRRDQAFISIMGPIGGGLLALVAALGYVLTRNIMLGAASVWMVYINLFNLMPLSILDGGQLMDTITYSVGRKTGFVFKTISTIAAIFILWHFSPILSIFVSFLGVPQVFSEYKNLKHLHAGAEFLVPDDYIYLPRAMSKTNMILTAVAWVVTAGILFALKFYLENVRHLNMMDLFHR